MKWLSLLLAYLPVVLQTVTSVEASIANVPGTSKKQVAMDIITTVAGAGEKLPEAHVQQISGLVDVVVGTLNKSGVFATSPAKATA
jgi:hypothetical protein